VRRVGPHRRAKDHSTPDTGGWIRKGTDLGPPDSLDEAPDVQPRTSRPALLVLADHSSFFGGYSVRHVLTKTE